MFYLKLALTQTPLHVPRQRCQAHRVPRPVQRGTTEYLLLEDKRGQPKLSRSDFVHLGKVDNIALAVMKQ
jgi:hypothetical protein